MMNYKMNRFNIQRRREH